MKLISTVIPLVALFSVTSVVSVNVVYGSQYDDTNGAPTLVHCFNASPLEGINNFGGVNSFPYIGGSNSVMGNTSGCGTCWEITHGENLVVVTIVDYAEADFSLSLKAMDKLTNGYGQTGQIIDAIATQIDGASCRL